MNPRIALATAMRVLRQVVSDRRTMALLLVVPNVLIGLVAWLYSGSDVFQQIGPAMLALFPFIVMFMVASITTLRERRSGTLERLLAMPMNRIDYILGYAIALALLAALQTVVASLVAIYAYGLDIEGSFAMLVMTAVSAAVLGATLGLLASAFAASEFQVAQFMPALIIPQILLGGLLMPRESMPAALHVLSDYLPLTHAIEAVDRAARAADGVGFHIGVVIVFVFAAILLGALTLRRQTP